MLRMEIFFVDFFNVFKIFVKIFAHNEIYGKASDLGRQTKAPTSADSERRQVRAVETENRRRLVAVSTVNTRRTCDITSQARRVVFRLRRRPVRHATSLIRLHLIAAVAGQPRRRPSELRRQRPQPFFSCVSPSLSVVFRRTVARCGA